MGRIAAKATAALLAVALVGATVLHLPLVQRQAVRMAAGWVERTYGVSFTADDVRVNLLARNVRLVGVRIAATHTPATPFFTTERVELTLPSTVFRGAFAVNDVRLDGARVNLVENADGSNNWPRSKASSGEPNPIPIDRIVAPSLSVHVALAEPRVAVDLPRVALDVGRTTGSLRLVEAGRLAIGDVMATLTEAAGNVSFDGRRLRLTSMRIVESGAALRVDGLLDLITRAPRAGLAFSGEGSLPRLMQWAGSDLDPRGQVRFEGKASGPLTALTVTARARSNDLAWQTLRASAVDVSASIDPAQIAASYGLRTADGQVSGSATFVRADASADVRVAWRSLSAASLQRMLAASWTVTPAALATGEARLRRPSDATWTAEAINRLDATPSRTGVPMAGRSRFTWDGATWRLDGVHEVDGVDVDMALTGRDATGTLRASSLAGEVHLSGRLPRLLPTLGLTSGDFGGTLTLAGTVAAPSVRGAVNLERVALGDVTGLAGPVLVTGTLDALEVDATLGQGANHLRALLTVQPLQQYVNGRVTAHIAEPATLLPGVPVQGTADLAFVGDGRFNDLRGQGTVAVTGAQYGDVHIGTLKAQVEMGRQVVAIRAEASELNASAMAVVGLTDRHAVVDLDAPALSVAQVWPLGNVSGALRTTMTASGRIDDWRAGTAVAHLRGFEGRVGDVAVRVGAPATVGYANGLLTLGTINGTIGETQVSLSGSLPIDEGRPARATTETARVEARLSGDVADILRTLRPFIGDDLPPIDGSGPARAVATVTGSLARPELSGTVDVGPAQLTFDRLLPFQDVRLTARLAGDVVGDVQASADWQGARITATGSLPLALVRQGKGTASDEAALAIRAVGMPPRLLTPFVSAETLASLEGAIDVSADLRARTFSLDAIAGSAQIDRIDLRIAGLPIEQREASRIEVAGGIARVTAWNWTGPGSTLGVHGTVGLTDRQLALTAGGRVDLRLISPFIAPEVAAFSGFVSQEVVLGGTVDRPEFAGSAELAGGEIRVDEAGLIVTGLTATASLTGDRIDIPRFTGLINGGSLAGTSTWSYGGTSSLSGRAAATIDGMALDVLSGLRSEADAVLTLDVPGPGEAATALLAGTVTLGRGSYREPFSIANQLRRALSAGTAGGGATATAGNQVALDVRVVTDEDLEVENNVARLELGADLRVTGTVGAPSVAGRAELREGGELFLGNNRYTIDSGAVDFIRPDVIEPTLQIEANTRAGGEEIVLVLSGPPDALTPTLSSTSAPELGQPDLYSLLLTGRRLEDVPGAEARIVAEQAIGYLAGDVLGVTARAVGLDSLRLGGALAEHRDPAGISTRIDPVSRITLGKRLGDRVDITLSQSLRDGDAQTWLVDYRPLGAVNLRLISDDDTLRSYQLRHEWTFGGPPRVVVVPRPRQRVASVTFDGDRLLPEPALRDAVRLGVGDRFEAAVWQRDRDRLVARLHAIDRLEARVDAERHDEADSVALTYRIAAGPRAVVVVEGIAANRVETEIRDAWTRAVVDPFLERDAAAIVRSALARDRYLNPDVSARVEITGSGLDATKTLRVQVQPGVRAEMAPPPEPAPAAAPLERVSFDGNRALTRETLDEAAALTVGDPAEPATIEAAQQRVVAAYRRAGLGGARVTTTLTDSPTGVAVAFAIVEGPRQVVREIVVTGNRRIETDVVLRTLALAPGDAIGTDAWLAARTRLFEMGLFRRVDVTATRAEAGTNDETPMRVDVTVEEWPALRLRYGLEVAEVRPEGSLDGRTLAPGFSADVARRALFGRAITLGGQVAYQRREQRVRTTLGAPTLLGWPIASTLALERVHEVIAGGGLRTNTSRVSWEQRADLDSRLQLSYAYAFERDRTFDPLTVGDPLGFDITVNIARLTGAAVFDTRDDLVEPSRGMLLSSNLESGLASLGSELRFLSHLGQAYWFRSWGRVVFASAARLGAIKPLGGQDLIASERFFGGGSRTVRGIGEDALGPRNVFDEPAGGGGVAVFNQEVRVPLFWWFRGVAFVDAGNVFERASDIRLGKLTASFGGGLRVATPLTLLRVDYGRLWSPRDGERAGRWTFGIGHAF